MTRRLILPEVADTVDPQLKYALFGKLADFQREEEPVVVAADDGRKLLEAGVQPRGGWCGPLFTAGVSVFLLALAVFRASNASARADAIAKAKKYKAEYERTGSNKAFDAYIKWERELSRLLREAQEAAYTKAGNS